MRARVAPDPLSCEQHRHTTPVKHPLFLSSPCTVQILSVEPERIVGISLPDDAEVRWFTLKAGFLAYDPDTSNYFALVRTFPHVTTRNEARWRRPRPLTARSRIARHACHTRPSRARARCRRWSAPRRWSTGWRRRRRRSLERPPTRRVGRWTLRGLALVWSLASDSRARARARAS